MNKRLLLLLLMSVLAFGALSVQAQDGGEMDRDGDGVSDMDEYARNTDYNDPNDYPTCNAQTPGVTFVANPCGWNDATEYTGWHSACKAENKDADAEYKHGSCCCSARDNCCICIFCPPAMQPEGDPPADLFSDTYGDSPMFGMAGNDDNLFFAQGDGVLYSPVGGQGSWMPLDVPPDMTDIQPQSLSVSPDGSLVAVGTAQGDVYGLPMNGSPSWNWDAHEGTVSLTQFGPDGVSLSTVGSPTPDGPSNEIKIWDTQTQTQTQHLSGQQPLTSIDFNPDGVTLAAGDANSSIWVWDATTGDLVVGLTAPMPGQTISDVDFSPDGKYLAGGSNSQMHVYDANTWDLQYSVTGDYRQVEYSPDGSFLYGGSDTTISALDPQTGDVVYTYAAVQPGQALAGLVTTPDGVVTVIVDLDADGAVINSTPALWPAPDQQPPAPDCTVTASNNVNLRGGPGTTFDVVGTLAANTSAAVTGQAMGADAFVWWFLDLDAWVRSDVVNATGDCQAVPTVQP